MYALCGELVAYVFARCKQLLVVYCIDL